MSNELIVAEVQWASGLFEGEGSIFSRNGDSQRGLEVALSMVDEDSVRRFHRAVLSLGRVYGPYGPYRANHHQPYWKWSAHGYQQVQAVVALLWNGLGRRRRARASEVLLENRIKKQPGRKAVL